MVTNSILLSGPLWGKTSYWSTVGVNRTESARSRWQLTAVGSATLDAPYSVLVALRFFVSTGESLPFLHLTLAQGHTEIHLKSVLCKYELTVGIGGSVLALAPGWGSLAGTSSYSSMEHSDFCFTVQGGSWGAKVVLWRDELASC